MPSTLTHDVVATIGEYTDRASGQTKKRYLTVGKCFTDDQGRQSIKLDALPVGPAWSGWLSLYPAGKQSPASPPPESGPNHPDRVAAREKAKQTPPPDDDGDDDIPF